MLEPAWSFQKLTVRSKKCANAPTCFWERVKNNNNNNNNNNKKQKQMLAVLDGSLTVLGATSHIEV